MITFDTVNELTLKVTCRGNDMLFTKAGASIAGQSAGGKNYRFEKVLLGPQQGLFQATLGSLARRVTGENLPLMKVIMSGDSETYYANLGQHMQLQVNYLNNKELHEAQENPDEHENLMVRVTGYSGYFTMFDASLQNDIIKRTEQEYS